MAVEGVVTAAWILLAAVPGRAQVPSPSPSPSPAGTTVTYGDHGLVIKSGDGNFAMQVRLRLQFRLSTPFDADPETPEDFADPAETNLSIRRPA